MLRWILNIWNTSGSGESDGADNNLFATEPLVEEQPAVHNEPENVETVVENVENVAVNDNIAPVQQEEEEREAEEHHDYKDEYDDEDDLGRNLPGTALRTIHIHHLKAKSTKLQSVPNFYLIIITWTISRVPWRYFSCW